jgi:uncharacterized pyridoxal phosphate-containing UPF0001 family protein
MKEIISYVKGYLEKFALRLESNGVKGIEKLAKEGIEKYAKEGIEKFTPIKEKYNLTLHHLGPVQSGNSKKLFGIFDYTHGVSSLSSLENLLKELQF